MSGSTCLTFEEPELACMLENLQKGKKGSSKGFREGKNGWNKDESRHILKTGKGGRLKLQSDRLNRGWKDQPAHGTNKGRGRSQLAQVDDLLARTRCFKCGELGHLAKDLPSEQGIHHKFRYFHQRNGFCADHCRNNSWAGVSRNDFAGVSRADCAGVSSNDSRVRDSRNESRADDDSRNEPSMYVGSRNGPCVEVDFQRDDETFLDVRKDDVTFLDVQTDGVTLLVPCSSSSFTLGSVVVAGPREKVCSDMKLESDGGTDDSTSGPLAKSVEMERLVGIAVANGTPIRVAYKDVRRRMRIEASSTEGTR